MLFSFNLIPIFLCRTLVLVVPEMIISLILNIIGKILLLNVPVRIIVRIFVALKERTLEMYGRHKTSPRPHVLKSRINCKMLSV